MPLLPFNSVGGYSTGITGTSVIDATGNFFGVGATFSSLVRFNSGISSAGATFSANIRAPNIVNSVNGLTGGVTFYQGSNITLTTSAAGITIDSVGGSGGGSGITLGTPDYIIFSYGII